MSNYPIPTAAPVFDGIEDDQTLADRDQTLAGVDQTGSDIDQTAADRDQAAVDSDRVAIDRDLGLGGDLETHDSSRQVRTRTAQQRQYSARGRVEAGGVRDQAARARDLTALARDRAAERRDHAQAVHDGSEGGGGSEIALRRVANRRNAAADRAAAAQGRARAAADREQAATDRAQAIRDVQQAHAERDALLQQLAYAENDGLTERIGGDRRQAVGDHRQRLVPGDAPKGAVSLRTGAQQRRRQPGGGIEEDAVAGRGALAAQPSPTDRVVRITAHVTDRAVALVDRDAAGVVAIAWTGSEDHLVHRARSRAI